MNVYQLLEDNEHRLYQAETMHDALNAAFEAHLKAVLEPGQELDGNAEREHWERDILQGVTLIGELEN